MGNQGYVVRCDFPIPSLGRLRLPRQRVRFQDGYVRFGLTLDRTRIVCTLVDAEDALLRVPDQLTAALTAERMGRAVELMLARTNRFEAGEHPGDASKIVLAVA